MYMRKLLLVFASVCSLMAVAQQERSNWQTVLQETMSIEDVEGNLAEDTYDYLERMAEHPLELNHATREQLEQLPFLSAQQVMDIQEYLDRYGPMRSMGELRMIRSLDYPQLSLLPYFTYVGEQQDTIRFPKWKNVARYGKHKLTATVRIPFYERKGDRQGYLGSPYRHSLRYEFTYGDFVRLGLSGFQDAGEPFLANRNRWGYDTYTYSFQINKLGPLQTAVVGKYKLSAGMGLVLNNSFSLGKLMALQNMGRTPRQIRPHNTRSVADYFQGVASTVSLSKKISLTAFLSYRPLDATLNNDSSVRTVVTTGYHRTETEMGKKHNTYRTSAGGTLMYRESGFHIGANLVRTHQDRELIPDSSVRYKRYYPKGNDFLNASADYGYTSHLLSFSGETAVDGNGHLATINALSISPYSTVRLMALQRFYSYRYTSLHAHSFSEGGRVQNESGVYVGGSWQATRRLLLSAYADFAYFPWLRYRVSAASTGQDYLVEATYKMNSHWVLKGRYRLHRKEQDDSLKSGLMRLHEHRSRLSLSYSDDDRLASRTQIDFAVTEGTRTDRGCMLSQQIDWRHDWLQLGGMAGWFETDSYASRVYVYERQFPGDFSFPVYFGRGMRLSLWARAGIANAWQLNVRLGYTHYYDRESVGSGLQEIGGSSMTDMDLQLHYKF